MYKEFLEVPGFHGGLEFFKRVSIRNHKISHCSSTQRCQVRATAQFTTHIVSNRGM